MLRARVQAHFINVHDQTTYTAYWDIHDDDVKQQVDDLAHHAMDILFKQFPNSYEQFHLNKLELYLGNVVAANVVSMWR